MSLLKNEKKENEKKMDETEQKIIEDFNDEIIRQDKTGYDVVVNISPLNVRRVPSLSGELIEALNAGDIKTIVEEKGGWGRLSDGGWVLLAYVEKK